MKNKRFTVFAAIALIVALSSIAIASKREEFPERRDAPAPPVINPRR